MSSPHTSFVVSREWHDAVVVGAFMRHGYSESESRAVAAIAGDATWHGVRTHNAIKAYHIERKHRGTAGGSLPGAQLVKHAGRFPASQQWNAQRKLGPSVAFEAMETCMVLAENSGIGQVSVDGACHYLWGGGYVLHAARRGYIGYTCCVSSLTEVVPFGGKFPTLGTNPHSWAFPTSEAIGFPILIDWATSRIAMGRIEQCRREGTRLPPNCAVDATGAVTDDPGNAAALLPFGEHKGYGLSVVNELFASFIGGSTPTLRNRAPTQGEKQTSCFYFQAIHPEALQSGAFSGARDRIANVRAVLNDIVGHGNSGCLLPGELEARAAQRSAAAGGLLFSSAELAELNEMAGVAGLPGLDPARLRPAASLSAVLRPENTPIY